MKEDDVDFGDEHARQRNGGADADAYTQRVDLYLYNESRRQLRSTEESFLKRQRYGTTYAYQADWSIM